NHLYLHSFPTRRSSDLEFKLIKNALLFDAFFQDVYAKVEIMSDDEPHLYVQQRGRGGVPDPVMDPTTEPNLIEDIMGLVHEGQEDRKSTRLNSSHSQIS